MHENIFVRILIAVIAVVLIFALIAPVSRLLGFGIEADLEKVIRICVGAIAVFYILSGHTLFKQV